MSSILTTRCGTTRSNSMTPNRPTFSPRLRLVLAAGLFALWTGWLLYQVLTTSDAEVVSRPQLRAAPVIVEADLSREPGDQWKAVVTRVYKGWEVLGMPPDQAEVRKEIVVENLSNTRGWKTPGAYILALQPNQDARGKQAYEVVAIPRSPGFPPPARDAKDRKRVEELIRPPIYPATESTRAQVREALAD